MGQQWETQDNLARELEVATQYAAIKGCEYEKLPKHYKADYAFLRDGELVAIIEIRCRNVSSFQYPSIMVSAKKWSDVKLLADQLNVPAMFVVKFTDGIFTLNMSEQPDRVEMGGRNQMRDSRDRELVAHFDMARMKKVAR